MMWYEHLFGVLGMLFCFVGIPVVIAWYASLPEDSNFDEEWD